MYSGITSGRVLNGELLYTKILEVLLYKCIHQKLKFAFNGAEKSHYNLDNNILNTYSYWDGWMDERCFRPLLCTVKAELGRGQPGLMR